MKSTYYKWMRETHELENRKSPELQRELDELEKKYLPNLQATAFGYKDYIELFSLKVTKNAPIGTGSAYMKELCDLADRHKKIIVLSKAKKGYGGGEFKKTSSVPRLAQFYGRFGFVSNYSRRDYRPDLRGDMHRYPKS